MENNLVQKVINTNLDLVSTEIIPLIDNSYARVSATEVLERLKTTVIVLTDDNAANKDQVALIWGTLTSDPNITEAVRQALLEAISKIDEPAIQEGLSLLIPPITKTLVAVTDNVKPDGAQLKQIWKEFLESPEFIKFVLSNLDWILSRIIKDKKLAGWISNLIKLID